MKVLDPGVGTGELLRAALDREPGLEVRGWDIDAGVIEAAGRLVPEASLELRSALEAGDEPGGFDLVIGNPPYFQVRLGRAERERFSKVISGRANVFALFFQAGLEQVAPGGSLAFIVPPSMNSGAYFEALREYLAARAEITALTVLSGNDLFEGANTAVQLLVLRRGEAAGDRFVFRREVSEAGFRRVVFSAEPDRLAAEFEGRRTLWELGLFAATGQVVWNQNRDRLFAEPAPGRVPLIWSHHIGEGELRDQQRAGKPGFYDTVEGRPPLVGPAIVVNRVVGAVGRGELRAALIPAGREFLAENHVNVLRARPGVDPEAVEWERILASLTREGVAGRVRLLTGNTQISATELTHLLPLG
ncbi:MAG: SAM-dependent DNA methyltransferase [Solirubrobacterales bacterium]|nr:SAM-dependent DNA methyltransferase [Solirubrobacterales bacterium]